MIEDYLDGEIQELLVCHVVSSVKVLKREVGEGDGYLRIKCNLSNGDILEFAEYIRFIQFLAGLCQTGALENLNFFVSAARIRSCLARLLVAGGLASESRIWAASLSPWLRLAWSSDDGLPNNTVGGLVQAPDGFLWLGTPNGMARFDELRFEDLPSTNFISPPDRGIITMVAARGGGMHLGMDRGAVISFQSGQVETFFPNAPLSQAAINSLTEDSEGAVWVAYRDGSLDRIENGKITRFTESTGLAPGYFSCSLACDTKGRLWFAKNGHFWMKSSGRCGATFNFRNSILLGIK